MITEKHFSSSHAGFWRSVLPMAETYIRSRNLAPERFARPLISALPTDTRGLINEVGFQMYVETVERGVTPLELPSEVVTRCTDRAFDHIRRMRQYSRRPPKRIDAAGLREAEALASRLREFFAREPWHSVVTMPRFPGCGWLDEAYGDVLADGILFEVKAGGLPFRSADLKQVLCYCALNFASKSHSIVGVCLVNPRRGVYVQDDIEELCRAAGGASAAEVLTEIIEYVSEPTGYRTG